MSLKLFDMEEVYLWVLKRMNEGWVLFAGDSEAIISLEETVYTPDTNKNADFEAASLPPTRTLPFRTLYIGKKTPELREVLNIRKNDEDTFNSLVGVIFHVLPDGQVLGETKHLNPEIDRGSFLEEFVKEIVYGRPEEAIDKEEDK